MSGKIKLTLVALSSVALTACHFLSADSIETMIASERGMRQQLSQRVRDFHRAVYWGDVNRASSFVLPEQRNEFVKSSKSLRESLHLVSLDVDSLELLEDDENRAAVELTTRYYRSPNYVIQTRTDKEKWIYLRYSGGWFLEETTVLNSKELNNEEGSGS